MSAVRRCVGAWLSVTVALATTLFGCPKSSSGRGTSTFAGVTMDGARSPTGVTPTQAGVGCARDEDCRLFSSGTCGCRCTALRSDEPDPACAHQGVGGCAGDPCGGARAHCATVTHRCEVYRPPYGLADGPCSTGADCRIQEDGCACHCGAVLTSARVPDGPAWMRLCDGSPPRNCGARSPCTGYLARCDPSAHRCVPAAQGAASSSRGTIPTWAEGRWRGGPADPLQLELHADGRFTMHRAGVCGRVPCNDQIDTGQFSYAGDTLTLRTTIGGVWTYHLRALDGGIELSQQGSTTVILRGPQTP